jgi:hypothetical protein
MWPAPWGRPVRVVAVRWRRLLLGTCRSMDTRMIAIVALVIAVVVLILVL